MNGDEIRRLSAREVATRVQSGLISARSVAEAYLARARAVESDVRAFLHLGPDEVLRAADSLDRRRAGGDLLGPLAGVPVAVKDNIAVAGTPTTCGSRILAEHRPRYDATAVARLRAADAILFGKTNLDEFGMGSSTENSAFHPTHNPWNCARVPGGSSGGSAAAVASGAALLALGSDTGGSVRQPAAFCGLVGVKPQYGRIPRFGLVAFASSLDTVGVLARSADDAALLLEALSGPDGRDATALPLPLPTSPNLPVPGPAERQLRVGVLRGPVPSGTAAFAPTSHVDVSGETASRTASVDVSGPVPPEAPTSNVDAVSEAVARVLAEAECRLAELGASVHDVSLPGLRHAVPIYHVLADAEASSNLARYDGVRYGASPSQQRALAETDGIEAFESRVRGLGFGVEVKRRILLGTFALSHGYAEEYYVRAREARAALADELRTVFESVDVLLLPTTPGTAFRFGERSDPLLMYGSDVYTVPASLSGSPAVSVPIGRAEGLPVGVQLMGRPFAERELLELAARLARMGDGAGSVARDPASPAFGTWLRAEDAP
ncbi:MAG: amidase family protein [Candidatus Eisenbacteria bacterium]